jgi:rhodanese-related sulfurtransferase
MEVKRITPEEAKALLDAGSGCIYLDVRTVPEFDMGHIPGAKNIPFLDFDPVRTGMAPNPEFVEIVQRNFPKDAPIICGCQRGQRSYRAAEVLLAAGFTNVVDMRGGYGGEMDHCGCMVFPGWAPRGFPTSTDSKPEDRYKTLKAVTSDK